jgi:phage baseplate assembly protein gpV
MEDNQNTSPSYKGTELTVSKLRFYSYGIVAVNKLLKSKEIEVTPVEELPMLDGELTSQSNDYKSKAVNAQGAAYETTTKTTVTIKAAWLPLGGNNRITAPDVRRGEAVMIYQFGDADKYYWNTLKEDMKLRKLETVIFAFSATKDETKDTTDNTTYYFEVSTHKKLVHFHTSKADGEPFGYDLQINTKDGYITITDDVGNYFYLSSADRQLTMKNVDNSVVDISKKTISITAADSVTIKTKAFKLDSKTANISSSNGTVISGGSAVTITSSGTSIN